MAIQPDASISPFGILGWPRTSDPTPRHHPRASWTGLARGGRTCGGIALFAFADSLVWPGPGRTGWGQTFTPTKHWHLERGVPDRAGPGEFECSSSTGACRITETSWYRSLRAHQISGAAEFVKVVEVTGSRGPRYHEVRRVHLALSLQREVRLGLHVSEAAEMVEIMKVWRSRGREDHKDLEDHRVRGSQAQQTWG